VWTYYEDFSKSEEENKNDCQSTCLQQCVELAMGPCLAVCTHKCEPMYWH